MVRAGWVLAGGASRRMGRDKALLCWRGVPLAALAAAKVESAAGSATLIGPPERLGGLGYPVVADLYPGEGPLGGIITALHSSDARLNLVLACDIPCVPVEFLESLLSFAETAEAACAAACSRPGVLEPLCAVWRRDALPVLESLFEGGVRKMSEVLSALRAARLPAAEPQWFWNINTPEEWELHRAGELPPREK